MENKTNKFSYVVGQIVGAVFIASLGTCFCGLVLGLTAKFLMWIF